MLAAHPLGFSMALFFEGANHPPTIRASLGPANFENDSFDCLE